MDKELIMIVEDVFHVFGSGVIVLGQIQCGKVEVGQKIIIDPEYLPVFETEIKGIEALRKKTTIARKEDYVGLILSGVEKKQVKKKMKIYTVNL